MSIAEQIERLKKVAEFDVQVIGDKCMQYLEDHPFARSVPTRLVASWENERLSKILRAYEQVIKIQAEALAGDCFCEWHDSYPPALYSKCWLCEAIASVEKLLEEVK